MSENGVPPELDTVISLILEFLILFIRVLYWKAYAGPELSTLLGPELLNHSFESHAALNMVVLNTWSWFSAWNGMPKFIKLIFLLNDPKRYYFLCSRSQSLLSISNDFKKQDERHWSPRQWRLVLQDAGLPGLCCAVRASPDSSPPGRAGAGMQRSSLFQMLTFHKTGK